MCIRDRRIRGSALVADVIRDFDLPLPEGPYDTVSGLVMTELGTVPAVGDVVDLEVDGGSVAIEVEAMDHRAVEWVSAWWSGAGSTSTGVPEAGS